jgi:hypothetical protein
MSRQIRIFSNNQVYNFSLSGRELDPEEVVEVYGPNDPNLNIYLPDTEPARPDYEPESDYERDDSDDEMLVDSEEEQESDVEEAMSIESYESEMTSGSDGSDNESDDDCLIVYGPETWEATRQRLNMTAILNGEVQFEAFEETIDTGIIDLTQE